MACKYWYAGKLHTEEEFKNILNNGLIDQLVKTGKVDLKDFQVNDEQLKEFQNLRKNPITLRIRRKIQTRINNERVPLTGEFANNNPVEVIKKAICFLMNKKRKFDQIGSKVIVNND
jgi:antitoxin component YwqK of YwqJK toxin-antitoxin module